MARYSTNQSDLVLEANFAQPAFDITAPMGMIGIHKAYIERFARFGLSAAEIVRDPNQAVLANNSVTYNLPNVACRVKFSITKLEISFLNLDRVTNAEAAEIATTALRIVSDLLQVRYALFGCIVNAHLSIEAADAASFLAAYVRPLPENVGVRLSTGAAYYYGAMGDRNNMSIVLDSSGAYPGAVYVRIVENIDGANLTVEQIPARIMNTIDQVRIALDLQPA